MEIVLDGEARVTRILDADDLSSLRVRAVGSGAPADALEAALGHVDEDGSHAWIRIAALRSRAGAARDDDWFRSFDAMMAYAGEHGWLSADGDFVRGHIAR
jgi:hypothetical protein